MVGPGVWSRSVVPFDEKEEPDRSGGAERNRQKMEDSTQTSPIGERKLHLKCKIEEE